MARTVGLLISKKESKKMKRRSRITKIKMRLKAFFRWIIAHILEIFALIVPTVLAIIELLRG